MLLLLKILLWIFISIILIVVVILFLPICISVKYEYEKLTVQLKILFLKFTLYPQKDKKQAAEPEKDKPATKQQEADKKDKPLKKSELFSKITFEKIIEIVKTATGAIKIIFKALKITKIEIVYPIYKDDPSLTAIAYGQTQAYLGGAIGTLRNFFNLSFKNVNLIPDFNNEYKYCTYFYCNIWGNAFIIVVAAIYALISLKRNKIL